MLNGFHKFLITSGVMLLAPVVAYADIFRVESLSDFSTDNPPSIVKIKLLSDENFYDKELPANTVINCELADIKDPKRLKRNATFSLFPISYIDENDKTVEFKTQMKVKFLHQIDIKADTKTAVSTTAKIVGNAIVPGLGLGVGAVEGVIGAEEGERLKSAATGVYNATPLSYVNKGKEIEIKSGDGLLVRLTKKKDSDSEFEDDEETELGY